MPASGKDTITRELCKNNNSFVAFKKHRSITALDKKKTTYFNIRTAEFVKKIAAGEFLQYHQRYERYYGISEKVFDNYLKQDKIPIIHIGRMENFLSFQSGLKHYKEKTGYNIRVIHILLWETIDVLIQRINKREKDDDEIAKRTAAAKQEYDDLIKLMRSGGNAFDLVIKNTDIAETCSIIESYVNSDEMGEVGYEEFKTYLKKYSRSLKEVDVSSLSNHIGDSNKKVDWSDRILPGTLSGLQISGVVTLKNTKTHEKTLSVDHCYFDYMNIKEEDNAEIKRFTFIECKIEQMRFFHCEIEVNFVDCFIDKLFLDGNSQISKLGLRGCSINNLIILKNSATENISLSEDTKIGTLDCRDGEIPLLMVNDSHIDYLRINKSIGDLILDNGGTLDRFSIEQEKALKAFLDNLNKKKKNAAENKSITGKLVEIHRQKAIILAALSEYEIEHKFVESDMCLIRLRSIDIAIKKLQTHNIFKKGFYSLEDFIVGTAFGWGVKILNTISTSCVVIVGFAAFFAYQMYGEWSIWKCLRVSVGNFFNLNSTVLYPELLRVDLAEEIVGVIMLTILTGVIVRKIIR